MNPIRTIRRLAFILAGLAGTVLALSVGAPAAFAAPQPIPDPGSGTGSPMPVRVHTVLAGGMPGWQITLMSIGAALAAATVAVLLDRAFTSRRRVNTTAA